MPVELINTFLYTPNKPIGAEKELTKQRNIRHELQEKIFVINK